MDKVVIDLYKKNYTLTKLSKVCQSWLDYSEQFKETTGKDYEPQVKQLVVFILSEVGVYMTESSQKRDYERRIKDWKITTKNLQLFGTDKRRTTQSKFD